MSVTTDELGRVLVVDDDPAMLLSLEGILGMDFSVSAATRVSEAEQLLRKAQFDVVVSDYEMPGGTGLDLVKTVNAEFPGVMVILLTGHAELAEVKQSETTQAIVRVLSKPYDPKRLIGWVNSTVKLARMRQATDRLAHRAPRYGVVLRVTYPHLPGAEDFLTNLSIGGCFVRTLQKFEVGQPFNLSIALPGAPRPLSLAAVVRWTRTAEGGEGIGVAFRQLSAENHELLMQALARWT